MPAVATKGVDAITTLFPFWLRLMSKLDPSIYALYQSLLSVNRSTAPKSVLLNDGVEPVKKTCPLVIVGPNVPEYIPPPPFATCPVLFCIENIALLAASDPQVWPSDAVPQ